MYITLLALIFISVHYFWIYILNLKRLCNMFLHNKFSPQFGGWEKRGQPQVQRYKSFLFYFFNTIKTHAWKTFQAWKTVCFLGIQKIVLQPTSFFILKYLWNYSSTIGPPKGHSYSVLLLLPLSEMPIFRASVAVHTTAMLKEEIVSIFSWEFHLNGGPMKQLWTWATHCMSTTHRGLTLGKIKPVVLYLIATYNEWHGRRIISLMGNQNRGKKVESLCRHARVMAFQSFG